jgi:hypothetical protein
MRQIAAKWPRQPSGGAARKARGGHAPGIVVNYRETQLKQNASAWSCEDREEVFRNQGLGMQPPHLMGAPASEAGIQPTVLRNGRRASFRAEIYHECQQEEPCAIAEVWA